MKTYVPNYYKNFHCLASDCKNSCCTAGWEIDIDENTAQYYKSVQGEFGNKLRKNIKNNSTNSSKCFSLNKNNTCPFLTQNKLCEIYIKLGEQHLCQICQEHPRFYEWFANYKEAGIGLCCEEAARIILTQKDEFKIEEIKLLNDLNNFNDIDYNEEIFNYLNRAREKIINYINNASNIRSSIKNIIWYANVLQQNIDNNLLDDEDIFEINSYTSTNVSEILIFLLTLEQNNSNWHKYLKNAISLYEKSNQNLNLFFKENTIIDTYLKNIFLYFIWRYFIKSVFDEDVISKVILAAISTATIETLLFTKWIENKTLTLEDCIKIVQNYSEEIEYNEDNIIKIYNECYENNLFNIENIIGLF